MNDTELLLRFLCYKGVISRSEFLEYKETFVQKVRDEEKEERVRHY